jgi:putative abortive infection protein
MLVNFTVKNYRSFKEERTFSMEASSIEEHEEAVIKAGNHRLFPLTIIYGANSSGKSNLISAIYTMRRMVMGSVRLNESDPLLYVPFALDEVSRSVPTLFEVQFIQAETRYCYGFEYTQNEIVSEWLYENGLGEEEVELFVRSKNVIEVSEKAFPEGRGKEDLTNANRLFLSLVAQLKGEKSNAVMVGIGECNVVSGIDTKNYDEITLAMFMKELDGADEAQAFFKELQLGFNRFSVKKTDITTEKLASLPKLKRQQVEKNMSAHTLVEAITAHNIYNEDGQVIDENDFYRDVMESEGTKKVIELSGPIFDTLINGKTLIVDELDARLHPLLTRNIVLLFMDPERNKHGAQLIFATHDTNLLDLSVLRRDQIWFAEKDKVESTDLYSLVEFEEDGQEEPNNKHDIERDYIRGRYGAIPFIGKNNTRNYGDTPKTMSLKG